MRRLLAGLALVVSSGCVSITWERHHLFEPPPPNPAEVLPPGTPLDRCLDVLGAPLWVWERQGIDAHGAALAWGWFDGDEVGFRISAPIFDESSVSFSYDRIDESMPGLVLFFDAEWQLEYLRSGYLGDLREEPPRTNNWEDEPLEVIVPTEDPPVEVIR